MKKVIKSSSFSIGPFLGGCACVFLAGCHKSNVGGLEKAIAEQMTGYSALSPASSRQPVTRHFVDKDLAALSCFGDRLTLRGEAPKPPVSGGYQNLKVEYKANSSANVRADLGVKVGGGFTGSKSFTLWLGDLEFHDVEELYFLPLGPCNNTAAASAALFESPTYYNVVTSAVRAGTIAAAEGRKNGGSAEFDPGKIAGTQVPVEAETAWETSADLQVDGVDLFFAMKRSCLLVTAEKVDAVDLGPNNSLDLGGCTLFLSGVSDDQLSWEGRVECSDATEYPIKSDINGIHVFSPARHQSVKIVSKVSDAGLSGLVNVRAEKYVISEPGEQFCSDD